jgi:hypothetical protein
MRQVVLAMMLLACAFLSADVVINEIMYNTPSYDNEWIELYNTGTTAVNIAGWTLVDGGSTSTPMTLTGSIPASGYFTIEIYHDADAAEFPFTPDFDGSATGWDLSNGGEAITLSNSSGTVVDAVTYDDASPWPMEPDGSGPSLELTSPSLDNSQGANWHASADNGGTPGAENSTGGTGEYTDVATMAELRAGAQDGTVYRLTGEALLTYQQEFRFQKYVQDATGGILIDESTTASVFTNTYNIGDGITNLTGTVTDYNGMLEFAPTADPGPASSTGNTITPEVVTLAELTANFDNYESELIKIQNVSFDATGTFATGTVYALHDATASFNLRTTFYDSDYIGTTIPTAPCNLVVLPNARSNVNYITPRDLADFTFDVNDPVLSVTPTPINFGLVNSGQTYNQSLTLANTGGASLNLTSVTMPSAEFTLSDVTLPLTLGVGESTTATLNLTPSFTRFTGEVVFTGNFGTLNVSVSYAPNVPASGIIINEIMYNTTSYDNEWVELYNADDTAIDLSGWSMIDGDATHDPLIFDNGLTIAAGAYFTIGLYHDPSGSGTFTFTPDWDASATCQWNLNNSGDTIHLYDANSTEVDVVSFLAVAPWPTAPNGTGPSLELINPALDNNLGESWQASAVSDGTPGTVNSGGAQIIEVSSIGELRSQTAGTNAQYRLTSEAILTFQQDYQHEKFIQDGTGGIMIFDFNGVITTTYNIGDGITGLLGTIEVYNDMMEFKPAEDPGAASSTGNTIAMAHPSLIDLQDNFETYEGQLVNVNGVHFQDSGTFATGTTYTLEDEDGNTFPFYTNFYSADYIGAEIPTGTIHVNGIAIGHTSGNSICARFADDMGEGDPVTDHDSAPAKFTLFGAYPNPFNPNTTIRFSLAQSQNTELVVFNMRGELVKTLVSERLSAGTHDVAWNGTDDNNRPVASGIYFYRLKSGSLTASGKTILLK